MPNTVKESSVRRTAAPPSPTPPPAAPQPVRPRLPPAGVQLSTLAWQLAAGCAGILLGAGQIYGGAAPFGLALAIGCAPGYLPAASLGAIVGSLAFLPLAQAGPLSLAVLAVLAARRLRPGRRWMSAGAGCAVLLVTGIGMVVGGGSGEEQDGGGILEAMAPKITIAGQEVSTADNFLELQGVTLTEADIEAIRQMSNLKEVYLDDVTFENQDLSWLAEFPEMEQISIGGLVDEIDLTPLSGLTNLTRLTFYQNNNSGAVVSDLSPLAGMTQMKRLSLCVDFDVKDLAPLAGMTQLQQLDIYGNSSNNSSSGLTDLSALAGMTSLTSLRLDVGDVRDFSVLAGMTQLQELRVYGNAMIEDISFLRNLTELRTLNMSGSYEGNPVQKDLTALSGLVKLTDLRLDVPIADFHGLERLVNLRAMRMYGGNSTYTNVDALAGLTELTSLYLPYRAYDNDNPLPPINLDGLATLTKLQSLEISDGVESLEPLRNLTELRELRIQANNSNDGEISLAPLAGLTKLTSLNISADLAGGDLSALSGLEQLRSLSIYHYDRNYDRYENRVMIRDLSPLSGLKNLNSLTINGTISGIDTSPVAHVADVNISE